MSVGVRLKQLRKSSGKTQRDLAKSLYVTASSIGMYERHELTPSPPLTYTLGDKCLFLLFIIFIFFFKYFHKVFHISFSSIMSHKCSCICSVSGYFCSFWILLSVFFACSSLCFASFIFTQYFFTSF